MSFILDALKKSETDRQRQASPALFEVKVAAPRRRFPVWAAALAVLLAVNMIALAWVMLRRADAPAAPPVAAAPPPASSTVPVSVNGQPGMMTVPATVTLPTTVNIPISSAPTITVGGGSADTGVGSTAPPTNEPLLEGHQPAVPPDYDARDYRPAITPEQASAIAAARRSGSLPSKDEILAQGNQLPELRLDLHVYDPNPAARFVFINMRKLREGESLPEGVRVDQITSTGAELSYHGKRFTIDGD
jgi:general secretion pathway protein B